MIRTHRQLKALVRNASGGNSNKAQTLIRLYCMERFLERVSLSNYKDYFVLKGGVLIASILGLQQRSTMDLDATIQAKPMSATEVENLIHAVLTVDLADGMHFILKSTKEIRSLSEYPGIRAQLEALLDTMRIPLQIDFSWGDVITPRDIAYSYKLLFEDRSIPLRAYSVETVLAEKIESILSRDIANSRMRDFYDVYHLSHTDFIAIDDQILQKAIHNTFKRRNSSDLLHQPLTSLQRIATDKDLQEMWKKYQKKFEYARTTSWLDTIDAIRTLLDKKV